MFKNKCIRPRFRKFQYKLIEDWERQQVVKGFTKETVALNLRNIDEFIKFNKSMFGKFQQKM